MSSLAADTVRLRNSRPVERSSDAAAAATPFGSRIDIRHVSRRFGGVAAVDDVDFTIEPGEFLTLLGPSGSGKTTLLGAIAGLVPVDEGDILVDGRSIADLPAHRRGFGMVFQQYGLFPHMTVAQNVAFPLRMAGIGRAESERRVAETLALLHIEPYAARLPSELSGGQQQRVAIARAIVRRPRVVLMDEPLSALDRRLREAIQIEIRALHKVLGTTIVFVTHDQGEALALSDRVAVLDQGRVVQIGTPGELYRRPCNEFVARFVGESNLIEATVAEVQGEVVRLASQAGHAFAAHRPLGSPVVARSVTDSARASDAVASSGAPPLAASAANASAFVGQSVKVLVRPERITLVPQGTPSSLPATVMSIVFLGEILRIDVRLASGESLQVRSLDPLESMRPAVGNVVHLAWQPRDAWIVS
ncbi:MAG: Fe3+/spermidine/putrescine transporter ATP-binding protein [Rhizobacter sp.]|nr:Fe3+/spermidine/putrescine transporter ATP-binding protein [Rhizobacter sp.]